MKINNVSCHAVFAGKLDICVNTTVYFRSVVPGLNGGYALCMALLHDATYMAILLLRDVKLASTSRH
jgi:hypothetical protein